MQESATYIKFSLVFLLLHFVSFYLLPVPLALMYGPIMYAITYRVSIKTFTTHLIVPLIGYCYLLVNYQIEGENNDFLELFTSIYYLLTIISMIGYYTAIYFKRQHQKREGILLKDELSYLLWLIYGICGVFITVLFLESIDVIKVLNFNPLYFIHLLIGVTLLIVLYYVVEKKKDARKSANTFAFPTESSKIMDEYEKMVGVYFAESKLFLEQGISLELLSEKIKIPKHQLSILFNSYMHKSFYLVIGEYRIEYAEKLLKESNNLTIESIAYECGFNSKSTFNKYFKEFTGSSPSEYRSSLNIS